MPKPYTYILHTRTVVGRLGQVAGGTYVVTAGCYHPDPRGNIENQATI